MIKAENVSVAFKRGLFKNKLKALDGFSLSVNEGDTFGLLGPNGAGKSTAMYCLLGLIQPDQGSVSVLGEKPVPGSALFRGIAYLPEEPHYHSYLTVEEAVGYYASLYGNHIGKRKVLESIDRVGLSEFKDLRLSKCSKGMKQKAGIAQLLVGNPKLLFLDEPTRGLDPITVKEFRDILISMNRSGVTIVLNSHVLSEIESICNRVAIMKSGRVLVQDELRNLMKSSAETYAVHFSGSKHFPDYVDVKMNKQDEIKAEIPKERLMDFMRFAEAGGLKVYECSLKKLALEDVFFDVVREC